MLDKEFKTNLVKPNLNNCTKEELLEYYNKLICEKQNFVNECKVEYLKKFLDGEFPYLTQLLTEQHFINLVIKKYNKQFAKFLKQTEIEKKKDLKFLKLQAKNQEKEIGE